MFKKKKSYKRLLVACFVLLMITTTYLFLDRRVRPTLFAIGEVQVTQMAVESINQAVRAEIANRDLSYQDFITVQRDYGGKVALMQANTVKINQMAADITLDVQSRLQQLDQKQISVPMGQILGSYIFADLGPYVKIKAYPMGTVKVDVIDEFEQAGINQTRHKIYLDFTTMVRLVIPLHGGDVKVATKVPVAESIIVGDVPEAVINLPGGILGTSGLK